MQCDRCRARLPEYVEEALRPRLREQIAAHLAGCVACRDELAEWRELRAAVTHAPLPGTGPAEPYWEAFETRVLARVGETRTPALGRWREWFAPLALGAALGLLVVLLGGRIEPAPAMPGRVVVARFDERAAGLSDAAAGDLDWESTFSWPVELDEEPTLPDAARTMVASAFEVSSVPPETAVWDADASGYWLPELGAWNDDDLDALYEALASPGAAQQVRS